MTPAVTNTLRVISLKAAWSLINLGAIADDGAEFGVAHSDYSASEIEEALEAATSIDIGDKVAQEQANRLVRSIGFFTGNPEASSQSLSFNDGKITTTKLNWVLSIGDSIAVWVRNGSSLVWTSGAAIATIGNLWVKD